jgi:hypothetical protein
LFRGIIGTKMNFIQLFRIEKKKKKINLYKGLKTKSVTFSIFWGHKMNFKGLGMKKEMHTNLRMKLLFYLK